jgi:hypothetical protein
MWRTLFANMTRAFVLMARSISGSDKARRRFVIPGMWEAERSRYLTMIDEGDPRIMHDFAPGITDAQRTAFNASPNSGPGWARAALAQMDEQGWFESWPPSARKFPAATLVPWLADRSVRFVRIYADDSIEPAPQT